MSDTSTGIFGNRRSRRLALSMMRRLLGRQKAFVRSEEGGMLFFALVILMIMLFTGGMAIDLMRYEAERTRIQAAADTAVLAAASMRQERQPVAVVNDWFQKMELTHALTGVTLDEGLNYRNVRADTRTVTRPYFMHMLGVDELKSFAAGTAEERRTNVEISMVLDISGSMRSGSKLENLRTAAREFVDRVLRDDTENRVSINLVPYNGSVILDSRLMGAYNVTHTHSLPTAASPTRCLDIPNSSYSSIPLSRTAAVPQAAFADSFSWAWNENYYSSVPDYFQQPLSTPSDYSSGGLGEYYNVTCVPRSQNVVRPFNNNRNGLLNVISNLSAVGATSIDQGLKWGASLLDPANRPMVSQLVSQGLVPGHFDGRPFDYDDDDNLKVIILMTDGEHFAHEMMNPEYKQNTFSDIYRSWDPWSNVWRYSIRHSNPPSWWAPFWVPHLNNGAGGWQNSAFNTGQGTTRLRWPEVWRDLRVKWVAWQLYARALDSGQTSRNNIYNQWMNEFRTVTPTSTMDSRLLNLCSQVKAQNVLIFGIAFEAPDHGTNLIRNCASPDRFYDVEGLDISEAFRSIRSQIRSLRLTQ